MSRPFRLAPVEPLEHDIQDAILRYLAVDRRVAWARRFNTGAHATERRDRRGRKRRYFIRYAFPGCSDVLGQLATGHLMAIEVKRPGNDPTEPQRAFLTEVANAGGLAILARSVDEVRMAIDRFHGERSFLRLETRAMAITPGQRGIPRFASSSLARRQAAQITDYWSSS